MQVCMKVQRDPYKLGLFKNLMVPVLCKATGIHSSCSPCGMIQLQFTKQCPQNQLQTSE